MAGVLNPRRFYGDAAKDLSPCAKDWLKRAAAAGQRGGIRAQHVHTIFCRLARPRDRHCPAFPRVRARLGCDGNDE